MAYTWTLRVQWADSISLVVPERIAEVLVKVERDDWLRQQVEVSPEDVRSIVNSIASPVKALAVPVG